MSCKNKQICSVCEGIFKRRRGCFIEKRCEGCRFIGLRKSSYSGVVYLPVEITSLYKKITDSFDTDLTAEDYIWNNLDSIAVDFGLSSEKLKIFNNAVNLLTSLDSCDFIDPTYTQPLVDDDLKTSVDSVLRQLGDRERAIIKMRFGIMQDECDWTLEEIGEKLSISSARVRQVEAVALKKLCRPSVRKELLDFI